MATKKNAATVELGRRGAKARNRKLTAEQRKEIARKAGKAEPQLGGARKRSRKKAKK